MEERVDVLQWLGDNLLTKETKDRFNVTSCEILSWYFSDVEYELRVKFNLAKSNLSPYMWGIVAGTNRKGNTLLSLPRTTKRYYKDNKSLEAFVVVVDINLIALKKYFKNTLRATPEEMTLFEIDHQNFSQNYGVEIL